MPGRVGRTVEEQVETERARIGPEPRVRIHLLGPVQIVRDGTPVPLPSPLLFAMMASRALAHLRRAELSQAAEWAVKAAGRPNAHAHILAIAATCLALSDRRDEARRFVERIRGRIPRYDVEDFLRAFRFDGDMEAMFRNAARHIGFAHMA
jgi:hypothetical protein